MTVSTLSSFYVERVDEVTVLCFTVRCLTEQNYDVVSEELLELVSLVMYDRPIQIVVELSPIVEIDELGLGMLQAFHDSIQDLSGSLILCRVQSRIQTLVMQAGFRCNISKTRSGAIASFGPLSTANAD